MRYLRHTGPLTIVRRGSHSAHRLWFRANLTPKYRRAVLKGEVARLLLLVIREAAADNDVILSDVAVVDDHVHLVFGLPTSLALADAMKALKSIAARRMFAAFPRLRLALRDDAFWASGFSAESLGWVNPAQARRYVQKQAKHHGKDALIWSAAGRDTAESMGQAPWLGTRRDDDSPGQGPGYRVPDDVVEEIRSFVRKHGRKAS